MAAKSLDHLRPERAAAGLKVNSYDRTSSLLVALLLMVGGSVFGLMVIYLSSQLERLPPAIPVTAMAGESRAPAAGEDTAEPPGVEDAPPVEEVTLDDLLEQVSTVASSDLVMAANQASANTASARQGASGSDSRGVGAGPGDSVREPMREIRFEPASLDEYAAWFDQAGLELGVLGGDNLVHYATDLSQPQPTVRTGSPDAESRLYFNSRGGPLWALDRQLAEKAGIAGRGQLILQFCKPPTQDRLLRLEQQAADGKPTTDILRTVFRVVKKGGRYDFEVEDQRYYR